MEKLNLSEGDRMHLRLQCMRFAIDIARGAVSSDPGHIVNTAALFEAYIAGELEEIEGDDEVTH